MIFPCGLVSDGESLCIPPDYLLISWDFPCLQLPHSMPSWHSISTQRWMSLLIVCTCGIGVGRPRIKIRSVHNGLAFPGITILAGWSSFLLIRLLVVFLPDGG